MVQNIQEYIDQIMIDSIKRTLIKWQRAVIQLGSLNACKFPIFIPNHWFNSSVLLPYLQPFSSWKPIMIKLLPHFLSPHICCSFLWTYNIYNIWINFLATMQRFVCTFWILMCPKNKCMTWYIYQMSANSLVKSAKPPLWILHNVI